MTGFYCACQPDPQIGNEKFEKFPFPLLLPVKGKLYFLGIYIFIDFRRLLLTYVNRVSHDVDTMNYEIIVLLCCLT